MKEYNGHRSWNAWNVSLWMGNDEPLYNWAMDCLARKDNNPRRAALLMTKEGLSGNTPDGGVYNLSSIQLALEGFVE